MKNKTRSIFVTILSALACACMVFACVFGFGGKGKEVHADEDPITGTKYIISVDGNYLLLATAFKLEQIKEGSRYAFGYFVTKDGGDEETHYSSKYWEGITLKTGDGTTDYSSADIFGEDYSFENGYVLIVEELDYVRGSSYDYQAFIWEENESPVLGTAYTGHQKFVVTINYNNGSESVTRMVNNGAKISIDEPEKDDYNFVGWKAQDGETLVDFDIENDTISADTTLVAQWKERPVVTGLADSHEYMIDKYNDVGYTVLLNGYAANELVVKNGETTLTESDDYSYDSDNNKLVLKAKYLNEIYRFGTSSYSFDLNGSSFTVSYENPENRVLNGGFETGSIYGWNSYSIWKKKETGMVAWTDDRVVKENYFRWDNSGNGYTYNKDGTYNLGIYSDDNSKITKDSGQERMGHLRSSNFTLGGSGWISFKLGGGRLTQFAYLSVRKTEDNVEIARFGNELFENTTASGTSNAQAFMFKYYYNLSDYIDEELYFVISDTSSNNWCVLSADSFFAYYKTAPDTSDGTVATDIKPTIIDEGSSSNAIKGGNPISSETFTASWTISGTGWDRDGSAAKSNKHSVTSDKNAGVGILRSAAFNLNGNAYLRFQYAGNRTFDKTIWLSVKEVGTNIEVKRFVIRSGLQQGMENSTSGKGTSDYDNHMCDTHDLSADKEYYLEFCDNETLGWGVFYVKEIQLCNKSKWDEKPAGDRAVSIDGIVTDYTYVNPY